MGYETCWTWVRFPALPLSCRIQITLKYFFKSVKIWQTFSAVGTNRQRAEPDAEDLPIFDRLWHTGYSPFTRPIRERGLTIPTEKRPTGSATSTVGQESVHAARPVQYTVFLFGVNTSRLLRFRSQERGQSQTQRQSKRQAQGQRHSQERHPRQLDADPIRARRTAAEFESSAEQRHKSLLHR